MSFRTCPVLLKYLSNFHVTVTPCNPKSSIEMHYSLWGNRFHSNGEMLGEMASGIDTYGQRLCAECRLEKTRILQHGCLIMRISVQRTRLKRGTTASGVWLYFWPPNYSISQTFIVLDLEHSVSNLGFEMWSSCLPATHF